MSSHQSAAASFDGDALSSELPLPLYLQLARYLRSQIVSGKLGHRDALPGERELAERFGVSRVTVRKALKELLDEGLLQQRQGAGTFVNRSPYVEQRLSTLTGFSEDMGSRGLAAGSVWLSRTVAVATPEETLALGISPGAMVSRLQRLRTANSIAMALELAVVPTRFLPEPGEVQGSLYETLRRRGFTPFRALQRLSAIQLSAEQAAQLGVGEGAAALYIERRTMLEDGTPLEFVRSQYRGDSYDFIVELNLAGSAIPVR
ncbi:GntR family transcriptional regulator [Stigmatella sp. ncwal1]|uniref:GntR family transcriptional regulator n=1 Tax=Stigmatella ashevillensis TaxID=2995309 RepID=A0ABT5D4R7_9BACT|nr:GntR family transcriptional regulator [Stigmatella ashevillena]MDC0708655.1 GntR family transcriptional regulator [Stigmatella ashevillena]